MSEPANDSRANPRRTLADSPLFWCGLFALAAIVALVAVAPKYEKRQERIERMAQARQEIANRRMGATPVAEASPAAEPAASDDRASAAPRTSALEPLVVLFSLLLAGCAAGLGVRGYLRAAARRDERAAVSEPNARAGPWREGP